MLKQSEKIDAKIELINYRYPSAPSILEKDGGSFIAVVKIKELLVGTLPKEIMSDLNNTVYYEDTTDPVIIIKGRNLPVMKKNQLYSFSGALVKDPKWGYQYNSLELSLDFNLKNIEDQKKFLSFVLTPKQIELLYDTYENPIKLLEDRDYSGLMKIKGIGSAKSLRMCTLFHENILKSRAYVELKEFGLSKLGIDKIVSSFGSVDIAVEKVKENPYVLIKMVRGYGWEKADQIARGQGLLVNGEERVKAYTFYFLQKQGDDNGNSCYSFEAVLEEVCNVCAPISVEVAKKYILQDCGKEKDLERFLSKHVPGKMEPNRPVFFLSEDESKIGLFVYRVIEKDIYTELSRLKNAESSLVFTKEEEEEAIKECEEEQGYKYTPEQKQAIHMTLNNNLSIITGSAGCVDCDTEYFNGKEWKKIGYYKEGEQVLAFNEDKVAELVYPERFVKYPCDRLWLIKTQHLEMCLSEEHNVYYLTDSGNIAHKSFLEVVDSHENNHFGFNGKFMQSFYYNGKGMNLNDADLKLMLAVICDGSFANNNPNSNVCRFHVKKERKKEELRKLFIESGRKHREKESSQEGFTDLYVEAPLKQKIFSPEWYNCTQRQLRIICDNILQWDGSTIGPHKTFSSTVKENVDFVQFAFSACGYRATISVIDRRGKLLKVKNGKTYIRKTLEYIVYISDLNIAKLGAAQIYSRNHVTPYRTLDGYKYCFTVPSHMWVMRRNGKILITGNTGKSTTLKPLVKILNKKGLTISQCALSGRASSLLSEVTGVEGKTIHRTLKWDEETNSFYYNSKSPLPADVVILDETSMVDEELFIHLISSIRSGSKLIMLGDIKQLPPIGVGNVFSDCLNSGYIQKTVLTQIHRQALDSGIISEATKVSESKSLCKNNFIDDEIRGCKQDFKICGRTEPMLLFQTVIDEFKNLHFNKKIPADDIQIIAPLRTRGYLSCLALNKEIQNLINPLSPGKKHIKINYVDKGTNCEIDFREGDRVIVNKNNYSALDVRGCKKAIFNGNIGVVESILLDDNAVVVHFNLSSDEEFSIVFSIEDLKNLNLAYAITCHKLQGSQAPYIIFALDNSAYTLLSRELVYTGITRAMKYCCLVVQPTAINTAVRISAIKNKITWLKEEFINKVCEESQEKWLKLSA